jgi:phosphate transport system protein
MPRDTLDRQIHHLQDEILLLGSMVEQAMLNAVDALKNRDVEAAHQIYEEDSLINEKRFAIENAILILIATQQPIARDLRQLAAILEVITDLERMGDYAKGIAKVTIKLEESNISIPHRDIGHMAELAVSMLHRALSAFISENQHLATSIPLEDDEVDELYHKIYRGVVSAMIADPETSDQSNLIMWVAHNIERMADRVTNICERTVFIATGELLEFDTTDDEDTE